jgi:hypothetical protein
MAEEQTKLQELLNALRVAQSTISGWTKDETGRVCVHTDVIEKAVKAALNIAERMAQDKLDNEFLDALIAQKKAQIASVEQETL